MTTSEDTRVKFITTYLQTFLQEIKYSEMNEAVIPYLDLSEKYYEIVTKIKTNIEELNDAQIESEGYCNDMNKLRKENRYYYEVIEDLKIKNSKKKNKISKLLKKISNLVQEILNSEGINNYYCDKFKKLIFENEIARNYIKRQYLLLNKSIIENKKLKLENKKLLNELQNKNNNVFNFSNLLYIIIIIFLIMIIYNNLYIIQKYRNKYFYIKRLLYY